MDSSQATLPSDLYISCAAPWFDSLLAIVEVLISFENAKFLVNKMNNV